MTDKRNTAIFINGGAGRTISSIPALEKFKEENPDDDFVIVCEGGTDFYKGHPDLFNRTYDVWHKNLFQDKLKDRNLSDDSINLLKSLLDIKGTNQDKIENLRTIFDSNNIFLNGVDLLDEIIDEKNNISFREINRKMTSCDNC